MPLLSIVRMIATLLSLIVLSAAGYLLWTWYDGDFARSLDGEVYRVREEWRLWVGAALAAWSLLGRFVTPFLLARADSDEVRWNRSDGGFVESPTGSWLYVETHGRADAPLLVFTHGWGMDSTFWAYAKRDLVDRFRLAVWDLPGLGKSKARRGAVRISDFAEDLAAVIAHAGGGRAVLVGHSIGGMTIQTLLRDNADIAGRLAGVVLLNTTYTNPLKTMVMSGLLRSLQRPLLEPLAHLTIWLSPLVWLSKWQSYLSGSTHIAMRVGFGDFVTRAQLEHSALLSTRASPAVEAKGDLAMFHWDATSALEGVTTPMLAVGGDKDIVTKLEASRAIARETPAASLEIVNGVNHMGPLERADLYNALIATFATSLFGPQSAMATKPAPSMAGPARLPT